MSTEKGAVKRQLSSEGTRIEADTANLDYEQQQHKTQQQPAQQQHAHAKPRPPDAQQQSQATQREPSSETADKENVKQPGTRSLAATEAVTAVTTTWNPESSLTSSTSIVPPVTSTAEDSTATDAASAESSTGALPQRQVIAVSASKSPAAFFNLARKFLVTNEMCDLSALEGAIVSAVDAAHLLERSQLASIVRIHTSYVNVEPKRRKQAPMPHSDSDVILMQPFHSELDVSGSSIPDTAAVTLTDTGTDNVETASTSTDDGGDSKPQATTTVRSGKDPVSVESPEAADVLITPVSRPEGKAAQSRTTVSTTTRQGGSRNSSSGGRELRRARIVVTVRRTESYKRWLEENPLQAIIASEVGDDDTLDATMEIPPPSSSSSHLPSP